MTQVAGLHETAVVIPIRQNGVRSAVRFPIALPLTIQTAFGEFHGTTANICANGLLLVCDRLPEIRGPIEFTMEMPAEILGSDSDVLIHCVGRIIRREPEPHRIKVAIVIDEYFLKA